MTEPPKSIGRYQVENIIGRGGMSLILLARDPLMKRLVAIKVLSRRLTNDPEFHSRFQREVEVIASLEHPVVVPIYDYGQDQDQPYYVMRYMPGGSLMNRLRTGPISLQETARIITRIAPGLDEAHQRGIIHRDLKPGNILFDHRGMAYLSDFGIVKLIDASSDITGEAILGTPSYVSPEIARGDPNIGGGSDIYSLGVLIFRMLTGSLPYQADTPMGLAMKHITEPVPSILDIRPNLPPACETFMKIALAKEAEDRFSTTAELAQMLAGIASGRPISEPVRKFPKGNQFEETITEFGKEERISSRIPEPPSHNLPSQSTRIIGRENELKAVKERLANPSCKLLTLLGPGGIGKTRLAVEAAHQELEHFNHGVYFIQLSPLTSTEFLTPTLANAIRFSFYSEEDLQVQLVNYLREKQMLLVLDNLEHLLADSNLPEMVGNILRSAPNVKLLTTSRERLNLQEEWILAIQGIEVPSIELDTNLDKFPSVELFIERAQKIFPDFNPSQEDQKQIVRICNLVGGLPLGIELAAAWVRLLTCKEIADEISLSLDFLASSLRDVEPRHKSLRAAFESSWNLLSDSEKLIFKSLSIFFGDFSRKAARQIAGATLQNLFNLVNKSLLRTKPSSRYEMLEVLRQYGFEKLNDNSNEKRQLQDKFCGYYSEFLSQREEALRSRTQKIALDEIGENIENIRIAWMWSAELQKKDEISKSLESMYRYFEIRGWLREGEEILGKSIEFLFGDSPDSDDTQENLILHARLLARQGAFLYRRGIHDQAENLLTKSQEMLESLGARNEMAFSLNYLGAVAYLYRNFKKAMELLHESLSINRETKNRLGAAISLHHLGLVARAENKFPEAKQRFQESLQLSRELGDRFGIAISLNNLGVIFHKQGDYQEAQNLHEESLAIREEFGDRWGIARSLEGLGQIAFEMNNYIEAQNLYQESLEIYREIGDQRRIANTLNELGLVTEIVGEDSKAQEFFKESLALSREIGYQSGIEFSKKHIKT